MKLSAKEITVFGIFAALMYVAQVVMSFIPNVHLTGVFIITLSVLWRWKALWPVMTYVLINGIFNGFAIWWLPYIYIWPLLVAVTSIYMTHEYIKSSLHPKSFNEKRMFFNLVCINAAHGFLYGTLYALAYGPIMRMDFSEIIAWIVAGLPYDAIHGCSNFILGFLILPLCKATVAASGYNHD